MARLRSLGNYKINSKLSDGDNTQTSEWFQNTNFMNEQNHCSS